MPRRLLRGAAARFSAPYALYSAYSFVLAQAGLSGGGAHRHIPDHAANV